MKRLIASIFVFSFISCAYLSAQGRDGAPTSILNNDFEYAFMSVSTNVLYDAALVPNVGMEFNIYDNWTLSVNGMWAWWTVQDVNWFWRIYGGEATVKKYFGRASEKRSLTGHHAGIYGQVLSYDLEAGNFGRMSPKLSYGAGVEYGYSFPVSNVLNIDVSVGLGYLGGRFYEYYVKDDHYVWRATVQQFWLGPTKAAVSLVWLLGAR